MEHEYPINNQEQLELFHACLLEVVTENTIIGYDARIHVATALFQYRIQVISKVANTA